MVRILASLAALAGILAAAVLGWRLGAPAMPPPPPPLAAVAESASPSPPATLTIRTSRLGRHQVMRAAIVGRGSQVQVLSFIVDTGASEIALPASQIEPLGFRPGDLEDGVVQTANGQAAVRRGRLASVEIGGPDGHDTIADVPVMFIDDGALGGLGLMGMSVLGRYRLTIDDERSQIVLDRKN